MNVPLPQEENLNRLPADERYKRDSAFRMLVDTLYMMIDHSQYTPTELREAVILAATKYDLLHVRPMIFDPNRGTISGRFPSSGPAMWDIDRNGNPRRIEPKNACAENVQAKPSEENS